MEDKKCLLREMNINVNKGDSPSLFERLKVTINRKGKVNGAEFDGVRITVQKGKRLEYTEDVKKASKVNKFKELVKRAEEKHAKTAVGFVEDVTPDVSISEEQARSVIRSSIENLESFLDEKVKEVESRVKAGRLESPVYSLTEKEDREARGLMELTLPTALEQEGGVTVKNKLEFVKIEETKWRERAEE